MKIHLMSDLHVESHLTELVAGAGRDDVLCLVAGDWANGDTIKRDGYSKVANPHGVPIVTIRGNHEWYDLNLHHHDTVHRKAAIAAGMTLLDRERFELNSWTILGCTLWSNFELYGPRIAGAAGTEAHRCISDFGYIRNGRKALAPLAAIAMYERDHAWLDEQLAACDPERTIVMTHFGPHPNSVHEIYRENPGATLMNPYYANNTGLIEKYQPALWVHGHTHELLDYTVGRTRVFCNPRGYGGERKQVPFYTNLILDLANGQVSMNADDLEPEDSEAASRIRRQYPRTAQRLSINTTGAKPQVDDEMVDRWLTQAGLQDEFANHTRGRSKPPGGWWPIDVEQFLAKIERKKRRKT